MIFFSKSLLFFQQLKVFDKTCQNLSLHYDYSVFRIVTHEKEVNTREFYFTKRKNNQFNERCSC